MIKAYTKTAAPFSVEYYQHKREHDIKYILEIIPQYLKRARNTADEEFFLLIKRARTQMYFSFPYEDKYIEWQNNINNNISTNDNLTNLANYTDFDPLDEATDTYIYSVFDKKFFSNLSENYTDHPEEAEKPLTNEEEKRFIFYLNNVFKPALFDVLKNIKEGTYRPAEIVINEVNKAASLIMSDNSNEVQTLYDELCKELHRPHNDLQKLMQEYAKACDFKGQLVNKAEDIKPEADFETLEVLNSIIPKNAIICNSKIANELIAIDSAGLTGNTANVSVGMTGRGEKKRKIKTEVYISYDFDNKNIAITGRALTPTDKAVHDGICTLYEAGNTFFTPEMVYRAMNGLTSSERITPERGTLDHIIDSIEVGTLRRVTINAEEQMKRYPGIEKSGYKNYFLPLAEAFVTVNGEVKRGYKLLDVPPIYEYSKSIKQVISVPIELLDSREQLKNSPTVTIIRYYLLRRIATMKSTKASPSNQNIRYSELFTETGIDESTLTHTQRDRKRNQIQKILEHFKTTGYITGYVEYKKGRKFEGVTIIL